MGPSEDELLKRARNGSVVAESILGLTYLDGLDAGGKPVQQDVSRAFRFLALAAAEGAPRARFGLARMLTRGLGVERNVKKAIRLLELAADGGEFLAKIELARIYGRGDGVEQDTGAAVSWYRSAIEHEGILPDCPEVLEAKRYVDAARDSSGTGSGSQ